MSQTQACAGSWRKNPLSNNVGGVKHSVRARLPALAKERHFALVDGLRLTNLGSLLIVGVRTQSDPSISSITNRDHDYFFELPLCRGAGYPIITSVTYCTPWRFPGSPACEPSFSNCP